MGRATVDLHCESFHKFPKRVTLEIDDSFEAVRGGQQSRLFKSRYHEHGLQPIVAFDGESCFIITALPLAKRRDGNEIRAFLHRPPQANRA